MMSCPDFEPMTPVFQPLVQKMHAIEVIAAISCPYKVLYSNVIVSYSLSLCIVVVFAVEKNTSHPGYWIHTCQQPIDFAL